MERKILNISTVCGLIIAAASLLFSFPFGLGVAFGIAAYRIYFILLSNSINELIDSGISGNVFGKMLRLLILLIPLLAGFLFPEYVSWLGAFIGLMLFKVTAVIYSIVHRG